MEHENQRGCLHKKSAKNSRPENPDDLRVNLQYLYGLGRLN
jgi:hypothetical protein